MQWQWSSVLAQWSKFFLEARMRMSSLLSMPRPSGGVIRHSALAVKLITWSGCRPLTTRLQPSPARRGATQPGHRTKRPAAASILPHRLFPHFPAAAPSAVERMDRLDDVQWKSVTWDYVEKCYHKGWLECYCDCIVVKLWNVKLYNLINHYINYLISIFCPANMNAMLLNVIVRTQNTGHCRGC